jgi:hypothetical protein
MVKVKLYLREGCPWCEMLVEALNRYSYLFTDVSFEVELQTGTSFGPLLQHLEAARPWRPPLPLEEAFFREALERGAEPRKALEASLKGALTPQMVVEARSPAGEARRVVVVGAPRSPEEADSLILNLRRLVDALSLR